MRTLFLITLAACFCLTSNAHAQSAGYSQMANQPMATGGSAYERSSGRNNAAIQFYGVKHAAYIPQARPMLPPPAPIQQPTRLAKPFSGVYGGPSVTPYLGLDAREGEMSLPNYYLFVKPQLEQMRMNDVQQAQYRQLQQQLNGGAASHTSRFMNNGGYYPNMTR